MANYYCDHGIYAAPVASGTVPTAAEDGNGKAKTAATMATLVVTFTGLPTSGQSITVGGITFTAGTSWTIGADVTTCATNFKNAVNASTTNVVNPTMNACPLRNAVNATSSAGVVTVYTRICGTEWNSVTETSTLANTTVTQWSGGGDGAFGYILNTTTLAWPTSFAVHAYGLLTAKTCYINGPQGGDTVIIRSGKTITLGSTTALAPSAMGSSGAYVTYRVDDSTEWSDGVNPVLTISRTATSNEQFQFTPTSTTYLHLLAQDYGGSKSLIFEFIASVAQSGSTAHLLINPTPMQYTNVHFSAWVAFMNGMALTAAAKCTLINCKITWPSQLQFSFLNGNGLSLFALGCVFVQTAPTAAQTTPLFTLTSSSAYTRLVGCRFDGFVTGSKLVSAATGEGLALEAVDCDFGGVTDRVCGLHTTSNSGSRNPSVVFGNSISSSRDFFYNDLHGFVEWSSSKSFPTLNAYLDDGVTKWSIYATPTTQSANIGLSNPLELPGIYKTNTIGDGSYTATLEVLIESTLSYTKRNLSALFTYVNTSGDVVTVSTYDPEGGSLDTSTAGWSSTSYSGQTWVKRSFSAALVDVADGSNISANLRMHSHVANNTLGVFVDPAILLTAV